MKRYRMVGVNTTPRSRRRSVDLQKCRTNQKKRISKKQKQIKLLQNELRLSQDNITNIKMEHIEKSLEGYDVPPEQVT